MYTAVHTVLQISSSFFLYFFNLLIKTSYLLCYTCFFLNGFPSHLKLTFLYDEICYCSLFYPLLVHIYLLFEINKCLIWHRKGLIFSKSDKDFTTHNNFRFFPMGQETRLILEFNSTSIEIILILRKLNNVNLFAT